MVIFVLVACFRCICDHWTEDAVAETRSCHPSTASNLAIRPIEALQGPQGSVAFRSEKPKHGVMSAQGWRIVLGLRASRRSR